MYKNVAATLQIVERARRGRGRYATRAGEAPAPPAADVADGTPAKLGPMQKIVAFGPL